MTRTPAPLTNPVKSTLRKGGSSIGTWMTMAHPSIAEILAQAGYEFVVIDLEHSAIAIDEVLPLIQVIQLTGAVPLVRLTNNDANLAKRVMDAGAQGIIVPMVNTAADARAAVRSVKYPPEGDRGVGLARAHGYGTRFDEYFRENNGQSLVVVQIEHHQGVTNAEEIFAVPGVDAYCIGPYDLSASLGVPGQLDHPLVKDAQERVKAAAVAAGVAPGLHIVSSSGAELPARLEAGYRFVALGVDMLFLGDAARGALARARDVPASRKPPTAVARGVRL